MMKRPQKKIADVSIEEFTSRVKNADLNNYFIFGAITLVLAIGLYALFSPERQNSKLGNPACGKIVIATDGSTLASNVSPTLSEARFFLVVDPLSRKLVETIRNPYRGQQPNPQIAYLIAGKGEEAVVVGNIDPQSYNILMQFGIRVFGGYQGQARKVVSLYRQARIAQAPQPNDNMQQVSPMAQAAQPTQAAFGFGQQNFVCPSCNWRVKAARQGNSFPNCPNCGSPTALDMSTQPNFWQGPESTGFFVCPKCNWRMNAQKDPNDPYPQCPNCGQMMAQGGIYSQNQNIQNNAAPLMQQAAQGGWGQQGMGMHQPFCPLPNRAQGGGMQGGIPAAWGIQDIYNKGVMDGAGMGNNLVTDGIQAAFGFGQQDFVCPSCNWRIKTARQGNSFPNCPNCGSSMALDMSAQNKIGRWFSEGQWAANTVPARPQMNQMSNQVNFWQGPQSTGSFVCPNCNWRMYAQKDPNDPYPRCPNCGQIMAQGGAYSQNQNIQNNAPLLVYNSNANSATPVAMTQNVGLAPQNIPQGTGSAPTIAMPHEYRGTCTNCHQLGTPMGMQNNVAQNQNTARAAIGGAR